VPAADPQAESSGSDWIRLASDEWLRGEIELLRDESLEFESEELDTVSLDWGDILQLRSAQVLEVRATGNQVGRGRVTLANDVVTVDGATPAEFDRGDVISVTTGAEKERDRWSGTVSLGATVQTGNTDQVDGNAVVRARRRTVENRVRLDYLGNFNSTDDVETANNHRATGTWDRFLTDRFFLRPVSAEYFRDPFQNIAHRFTLGTGAGYQIIDTSRTQWQVFAGPAYQWTWFDEVEPGEDDTEHAWAFKLGTELDYEVSSDIDLVYTYDATFTSEAAGRYIHHMLGGLSIDLIGLLDLDFSIVWDRIEKPQPDATGNVPQKDDFRYIIGIGYDF
jgi:hypothetical protein